WSPAAASMPRSSPSPTALPVSPTSTRSRVVPKNPTLTSVRALRYTDQILTRARGTVIIGTDSARGGVPVTDKRDVLARIKRDLDGFVGRPVRIKANKGRRRVVEREGTLEKTYPSLFVVKLGPDQQNRRVSFTYAD